MKALILVDIQNDFLPGGPLAVSQGLEVIPVANRMMDCFPLVMATQDWHPATHESFASNHHGQKPGSVIDLHGLSQVLWPDHCVQESEGARFAAQLATQRIQHVIRKGANPALDSYSGFYENDGTTSTGADQFLKGLGVREVFILGLATDYCVKFTALDASRLGYRTTVITDGCRAVNLFPDDERKAYAEMQANGVQLKTSQQVLEGALVGSVGS